MGLPMQRPVSTGDAEIEPDEHEAIQGAKSAKIRTLNDRFRKSLTGGRVMITAAVSGLPDDVRARAMEFTRAFDDFIRTTIRTRSTISAASRSMTRSSFSNMTTTTSRCSTAPKIQVTKKITRVLRSSSRTNTEDAVFLWSAPNCASLTSRARGNLYALTAWRESLRLPAPEFSDVLQNTQSQKALLRQLLSWQSARQSL
jgi:hypothetical protein